MAGRCLSRRLGPASRLVPFLAAGKLRHARPRALRRGAHPWLRHGRGRPQDVEVARQSRRAAGGHQTVRRRYSAPCGWRQSDYSEDQRIGPEILKTNVDAYRKLRNTMRWMLGTLAHDTRRGRRLGRHAGTGTADAAPACRTRSDCAQEATMPLISSASLRSCSTS